MSDLDKELELSEGEEKALVSWRKKTQETRVSERNKLYVRCDSSSGNNLKYFIWFSDDRKEKYLYVYEGDISPFKEDMIYSISYDQTKVKVDKYNRPYTLLMGVNKLDETRYPFTNRIPVLRPKVRTTYRRHNP